MGICLDTDASTDRDETEDAGAEWKGGGSPSSRAIRTPPNAVFQNQAKVKFDPPKVPVIFVLGGPGSGKVTHCDTLINEKRGLVHINMMDLLQQFALGNEMADFSQLPSKTVTEVLMLEMKMAPAAKAYLVSGYPRSMRDVVEYSEKIQVVSGVVLISWRQSVLQKQIDYGAKLGHVVLSLAKMELENFFKNVMPVADYFDQSDMLVAVNGERAPPEVYKDFRTAVLEILDSLENQEALLNGVTGMGRGLNDIPGSIVSVETAPSQHKNITETIVDIEEHNRDTETPIPPDPTSLMGQNYGKSNIYNVPSNNIRNNLIPPVIWVIGGPGSNKATLCLKAVGLNPGWGHFSIGRLLRTICDTAPRVNSENYIIKESLASGEMVPEKAIERLIETNLQQLSDRKGVIIDGYPRNMAQVEAFETKYHQKPFIILLDCSKLQLGRGRIDDTVSSFRRRLELFRELTLPMLKNLDGQKRLTIVDGDTDSPSVQKEFEKVVRSQIQKLVTTTEQAIYNQKMERTVGAFHNPDDAILNNADEDNMPGAVPTVSEHVSMGNGHLKTNERSSGGGYFRNSVNRYMENGRARPEMNGHVPTGANVRHMIENESYM